MEPGCGDLAPFGQARCERHAAVLERDLHAGPHRRIYQTDRWAAVRREVLARDRACRCFGSCHPGGGCPAPPTDVDHVIPLRVVIGLGHDPYEMGNLRALCSPCHSTKTAAEVGLAG